ncbi:endo-1,4-beta-xylanase 5 [Cajanus cajan]|nr:endo-1,4-beta-xylanase 5 [Cajanus cajan]
MNLVLLICVILFSGFEAEALSYDYSASVDCLAHPQKPLYNGGIIQNPELNNGLQGWTAFGGAIIEHRESLGNKYVVAHSRNQIEDSVSQKIYLKKDMHYALSAWIQVSGESVPVTAVVKTTTTSKFAGIVSAESNCWSMLKGGLTADTSGPAELYFESNSTSADILIDNVSLQPFTDEEWRSHQTQSIEKARKRKVLIRAVDEQGKPLRNATISLKQNRLGFPFGSAISGDILNNTLYQNWITSRFTVTTFSNEMKWYSTENTRGSEYYAVADAMLQFAKQHNIAVRGHNIFWDDPKYQPSWVPSLPTNELNDAVERRVTSVVSRYRGQLIAWDVVNENLHFSFFEDKLGQTFSAKMFNEAHRIDAQVPLYLNEYNTIEDRRDGTSAPSKYIQKLRQIQSYPGNGGLPFGIGLEAHFPAVGLNLPYMRASIDTLAATGYPVWITEIDVENQPKQTQVFEIVLREAHAHPKVRGIVMWTAPSPQGCYRTCLVDKNFKNLPAGNVVDKLINEWSSGKLSGTTDQNGLLEASLLHGDYEVKITHPLKKNYTFTQKVEVTPTDDFKNTKKFVQLFMK